MITINGEQHSFNEPTLLSALLEKLCGTNLDGIAAAVNGVLIPRSSWSKTQLESGDTVEIVQATSGG